MKIFIIGTGNVATVFGKAFLKAGHEVCGVLGRNTPGTIALASKLRCRNFSDPLTIPRNCDLYLIAVSDNSIQEVAKSLPTLSKTVVHTSGSTPLSKLKKFKSSGVFYPVESINKSRTGSLKHVPLCLEAGNEKTMELLLRLAHSITDHVYLLDSRQRLSLHVAAVIANNFTNHLLYIAGQILQKEGLPPAILDQLVHTTINNAIQLGPAVAQTGPARRQDSVTIGKHLKFLNKNPDYRDLYELLTRLITDVYNLKGK